MDYSLTSSSPRIARGRTALLAALVALPVPSALSADREAALDVQQSSITGLASFITATDGGAIPVRQLAGQQQPRPEDFLAGYGHLFGISDPNEQLRVHKTEMGLLQHTHTTYQQIHRGIPVFSGLLKVHQDAQGQVVAANGDYYPLPAGLNTVPAISADEAEVIAKACVLAVAPTIDRNELVIIDPGWYGDPPQGPHLAHHLVVTDGVAGVAEAMFVDAHTGALLDRWSLIHTLRDRRIYDGGEGPDLPGTLVRSEGDPATGDPDADIAYDYAGDVYDYLLRAFGRDGLDGAGGPTAATVHSTTVGCPNATWSIIWQETVYCTGIVSDDVVAHEFGHGLVVFTANLVYQNQGAQLHEHFADTFGELIDLFNGDVAFPGPPDHGVPWPAHSTGPGLDTPNNLRSSSCSYGPGYADGVRWLIGEDSPVLGAAIRDMWIPPCHGHPDSANSTLQTCNLADAGGAHSGNGVPNHAFAMVTDGKAFNGYAVNGIGPIKSGAVWYRALATYLTSAADFQEMYWALNQSAADLIGTYPNDPRTGAPSTSLFTATDANRVDKALRAVEMDTPGRCGASADLLDPDPPAECGDQNSIFAEDFESGLSGWTVSNTGPPTPYDWEVTAPGQILPFQRPGRVALCADANSPCNGPDESAVHHLDSPVISLPASLNFPTLAFTHFMDSHKLGDGGNVRIRVNGGAWQLIPATAFYYNGYNRTLPTAAQGSTNPLAGDEAFNGAGGEWGTTLVHLGMFVSGGESVQIRFDFGKDRCYGTDGWYLDDVRIYDCTSSQDCDNNAVPDDVQVSGGGPPSVVVQHSPDHSDGFFTDADGSGGSVNVHAQRFSLLLPKTIGTIRIWGGYYPGNTPPGDQFTVIFHADDPVTDVPGATVSAESEVPATRVQTGYMIAGVSEWEITLELADPVDLTAGTYWIEIFNDTTGDNDTFFWVTSGYAKGLENAAVAGQAPGVFWSINGTYNYAIELVADVIGPDCNNTGLRDDCETLAGGDFDADGGVGPTDSAALADCLGGPDQSPSPADISCAETCLSAFDGDGDNDVDLDDFAEFQAVFSGQ